MECVIITSAKKKVIILNSLFFLEVDEPGEGVYNYKLLFNILETMKRDIKKEVQKQ